MGKTPKGRMVKTAVPPLRLLAKPSYPSPQRVTNLASEADGTSCFQLYRLYHQVQAVKAVVTGTDTSR